VKLNSLEFFSFKKEVYDSMKIIQNIDIIDDNDVICAKKLVDYFVEQKYSLGGITILDVDCQCVDTIEDSDSERELCEYCKYMNNVQEVNEVKDENDNITPLTEILTR